MRLRRFGLGSSMPSSGECLMYRRGGLLPHRKTPMTIENDALCDDLLAWIKSPAIELPEYSCDPIVQRRLGRMLAGAGAKSSPHPERKLVVNSIQTSFPDKP
jgi:hypothetical protein